MIKIENKRNVRREVTRKERRKIWKLVENLKSKKKIQLKRLKNFKIEIYKYVKKKEINFMKCILFIYPFHFHKMVFDNLIILIIVL